MTSSRSTTNLDNLRVAIVHDWLVGYNGGEMVMEQILEVFPNADLYTLCDFIKPEHRGFLKGKKVTTSLIQKLPFARKRYGHYLGLMPYAVEQFDLTSYDLILSSSLAVAHGALTNAEQLHISYFNNTMVYAWDLYHLYLKSAGLDRGLLGPVAKAIMHYVRMWDASTANRVDSYVANSEYMQRRLTKLYGCSSEVIYPPVDVDQFTMQKEKDDYYIVVSRLVPFKRIDLIVDAFTKMPDRRLVIVGGGPEEDALKKSAGKNIEFIGQVPFEDVHDYVSRSKAFLISSVEPFGIAVVEAQATGTPVLAYDGGAAPEIVRDGVTGLFFNSQTSEAVIDVVDKFEGMSVKLDPVDARKNAERFSIQEFSKQFRAHVEREVDRHFNRQPRDSRKPLRPTESKNNNRQNILLLLIMIC